MRLGGCTLELLVHLEAKKAFLDSRRGEKGEIRAVRGEVEKSVIEISSIGEVGDQSENSPTNFNNSAIFAHKIKCDRGPNIVSSFPCISSKYISTRIFSIFKINSPPPPKWYIHSSGSNLRCSTSLQCHQRWYLSSGDILQKRRTDTLPWWFIQIGAWKMEMAPEEACRWILGKRIFWNMK